MTLNNISLIKKKMSGREQGEKINELRMFWTNHISHTCNKNVFVR